MNGSLWGLVFFVAGDDAMTMIDVALDESCTPFDVAANDVLSSLRNTVATVLGSIGGLRKPADLQKSFKLDWTLSWQLFQVAWGSAGGTSPLSAGPNVPSRTSLKKFLDSAQSRGVDEAKVDRVWASYERFERLVEVHAGDRTSFNSMVSAAAGMDTEWATADAQHRRNAYRAMSHVLGMQARAKHICGIYNGSPDGQSWDMGVVSGLVGLRMLRALPKALVYRMRIVDAASRQRIRRQGLGPEATLAGGYLLPDFSTEPLPAMTFKEMDAGWVASELERPAVGNLGACTLRFATGYFGHPIPGAGGSDNSFEGDVVVDKPVELLVSDAMVTPGLMRGGRPTAEVLLGNNHGDAAGLPGDVVPVLGDHRVEFLGTGPDVLATPDLPDYPELLRATAARLGWDIESHEAWRIRLEFPIYQATVRMKWTLPATVWSAPSA